MFSTITPVHLGSVVTLGSPLVISKIPVKQTPTAPAPTAPAAVGAAAQQQPQPPPQQRQHHQGEKKKSRGGRQVREKREREAAAAATAAVAQKEAAAAVVAAAAAQAGDEFELEGGLAAEIKRFKQQHYASKPRKHKVRSTLGAVHACFPAWTLFVSGLLRQQQLDNTTGVGYAVNSVRTDMFGQQT
jgi:outer membrane biosynthesis protein TonB